MFIAHHHDLPLDVASCFRLKCLDTLTGNTRWHLRKIEQKVLVVHFLFLSSDMSDSLATRATGHCVWGSLCMDYGSMSLTENSEVCFDATRFSVRSSHHCSEYVANPYLPQWTQSLLEMYILGFSHISQNLH